MKPELVLFSHGGAAAQLFTLLQAYALKKSYPQIRIRHEDPWNLWCLNNWTPSGVTTSQNEKPHLKKPFRKLGLQKSIKTTLFFNSSDRVLLVSFWQFIKSIKQISFKKEKSPPKINTLIKKLNSSKYPAVKLSDRIPLNQIPNSLIRFFGKSLFNNSKQNFLIPTKTTQTISIHYRLGDTFTNSYWQGRIGTISPNTISQLVDTIRQKHNFKFPVEVYSDSPKLAKKLLGGIEAIKVASKKNLWKEMHGMTNSRFFIGTLSLVSLWVAKVLLAKKNTEVFLPCCGRDPFTTYQPANARFHDVKIHYYWPQYYAPTLLLKAIHSIAYLLDKLKVI